MQQQMQAHSPRRPDVPVFDSDELVTGARIVDAILLLVVVEMIVLAACWHIKRWGIAPGELVFTLLSGVSLMLALRAALTTSSSTVVLACLTASLVFHVLDIVKRWKRRL